MAQDEIVRHDSPCSYDLDISLIDKFEERTFVISRIIEDPRFMITVGDSDGVFSITSSPEYEDIDFYDVFSEFLSETRSDFDILTKVEAAELFHIDKANMPEHFATNLMMGSIDESGNGLCSGALPFCTDVGMYQFPAGVNTGQGESGPCYDLNKGTAACLHSTPNPAWYYMRIDQPGNINIYMYSTPSYDIDFICWGPFDDYLEPCPHNGTTQLTCDKVVSCSYSMSATETCQIPASAQTGKYYILLITNYSNEICNINFSKTGGTGTTDCSILPPVMEYSDACYGNTLHLSAHEVSNASYSWTGPNGFSSSLREPHIDNVTFANSGTYSCTVTVPGQGSSDPMTLDIEILPELHADFTVADAVPGTPAQFTGTETTYPTGYTNKITSRTWDFGDGSTTATGTNPTHVYTNPGTYEVTYTIVAENETGWSCEDTKTMPITVSNNLAAAVSSDDSELCEGESTTLRANVSGGTQNYTYTWTPAQSLNNPNIATPTATPTETTTYKCVVSDGYNEVEGECEVTVYPQYNASTTVDETSCDPYIIDYYNMQTHQWDQMVFNYSYDGIIDLTTTHGCDSLSIDMHFVKLDEANVPLINDDDDSRKEVLPGSSWMPLQYKFEIGDITGGGVEQGLPVEYNWSITYHVDWTGIDNTETWILHGNGTNEVSLLVLSAGNATISCDVVTACGITHREIFVYTELYGVDETEGEEYVSIYPNPANTLLHIDFDKSVNSEDISIKIYSATGTLVDELTTSGSTVERSIQDLSDGLYFIKISSSNFNVIKRLTVIK
ncbi:MAG: PKD domain-containing protein [Bacteroidales bacterium]|nr:PKD domain-containing protein [Bacteroidales bacterium]